MATHLATRLTHWQRMNWKNSAAPWEHTQCRRTDPCLLKWYLAGLWTMSYKQTLQHVPCLQIYITSEIIICSDPCECWFSIPNHTRTKIWSYLTDEITCRLSDVDCFRAWGPPARWYRSWWLYSHTNFFSRPTGRSWITYTYRCRIVFRIIVCLTSY